MNDTKEPRSEECEDDVPLKTMMACAEIVRRMALIIVLAAGNFILALPASGQTTDQIVLRGKRQDVRLYDTHGHRGPVIVSSGDGGWIHLGPHIAEALSAKGFVVVGFDTRAYLASFTSGSTTLRPEDEPADYRVLADYAASRAGGGKPVLVGVSEGAGLSVLAATDPQTKSAIAGVVAVGLPILSELGWRWKDALIYITHGVPKEPTFDASEIVNKITPLPLAIIHSTKDEFVPLQEAQKLAELASEPKRLWILKASNHRFSDNEPEFDQRLLEAMDWIKDNQPR